MLLRGDGALPLWSSRGCRLWTVQWGRRRWFWHHHGVVMWTREHGSERSHPCRQERDASSCGHPPWSCRGGRRQRHRGGRRQCCLHDGVHRLCWPHVHCLDLLLQRLHVLDGLLQRRHLVSLHREMSIRFKPRCHKKLAASAQSEKALKKIGE
jgi:hypothetical protein